MQRAIVVLALALAATGAQARGTYKETLTKDEVDAAVKGAEGRLKVDAEAVKKCTALPAETVDERAALARCYQAAGSLGAALAVWKYVRSRTEAPVELQKEALRQLGTTHETVGRFGEAAAYHQEFAKKFPREADAPERMTRAVCIWRQLDDAKSAERGFEILRRVWKKPPDSETLCDKVRPIAPPPDER